MRIAGRGEPGKQRVAAAGAQGLLRRPERVAPPGGAYQREVRQIDAGSGERRRIRQMRRREPDHPLPGAGESRQGRHEQPQLADASGGHEQLGQGTAGPAAAGEHGVELGKAGRDGGYATRQGIPPPDAGMPQHRLESHDTVIIYSKGSRSSALPSCGAAAPDRRP